MPKLHSYVTPNSMGKKFVHGGWSNEDIHRKILRGRLAALEFIEKKCTAPPYRCEPKNSETKRQKPG